MMQSLGRRYMRYVNTGPRRTGTLWEGRYRAAPIDSEAYFLACCRYIELNPVRARMVDHPRGYKWSSFRAHADGVRDPLVSDHPLYRALGRSHAARQKAYRALFRTALADEMVDALRGATQGGWAIRGSRKRSQAPPAAVRPRCRRAAVRNGDARIDGNLSCCEGARWSEACLSPIVPTIS